MNRFPPRGAFLAGLFLALTGCATAPPPADEVVVIGAGADPCSTMTAPPRDPADPPLAWGTSWTSGYLRGYFDEHFGTAFDPFTAFREQAGRDFDVAEAVRSYCAEHGQAELHAAAEAIARGAVAGSGERTTTGAVAIPDAGTQPCGPVFADADRHKQGHRPFNWLFGYLRGRFDAGFGLRSDPLREALRHHGNGLVGHVETVGAEHCAAHPGASMWQVSAATAARLVRECAARGGCAAPGKP